MSKYQVLYRLYVLLLLLSRQSCVLVVCFRVYVLRFFCFGFCDYADVDILCLEGSADWWIFAETGVEDVVCGNFHAWLLFLPLLVLLALSRGDVGAVVACLFVGLFLVVPGLVVCVVWVTTHVATGTLTMVFA